MFCFFFFKQKTAYEMRISDWSSDVCSSDLEKNRQLYKKRRDVLVESFGRAGWDIPPSRASMFCWAPLPPAVAHLGSLEFSKQLLTHAGVAVAPGVGYGEDGEGFVRIAMVENEQRIRQAARNVRRYLQSMGVNTPSSVKVESCFATKIG